MQRNSRTSHPVRNAVPVEANRALLLCRLFWAYALKHKIRVALLSALLFTSTTAIVHPDVESRFTATYVTAGLLGAIVTQQIYESRLLRWKLTANDMRAEAARIATSQERMEKELVERQRAIATAQTELTEAQARLKTVQEGYQVKADVRATRTAQLAADRRITEIERSTKQRVADAEKRLSQVTKETNAAVAKANADMEEQIKVYKTKADNRIAVIERERNEAVVTAELARDEAIAEVAKAGSDSSLVVTQYGDMVADFERECAQRKKHLEEVAAGKVIAIKRQAQSLQKALAEGGQEYRKVISVRDAETEESINGLAIELSKMAAELGKQKALVAQLQAPKQFTQSTIEAQVGNRIQAFLSSRGVPLTCVDIGTRRYGEVPIYFEPIGCDVEDVEKQMEALYLHLGFNRMPSVSIENGKIKIVTQISSEVKPKAEVIKRVSDTRLRQAFLDIPFGLRFTGYTGRGKSTLLNNVIHLYEDELGVRFTIFDPKTDFPSAKYPKNKVYRGTKRCIENINLIGSTVSVRQEYRVLNDEEGTPIPLTHQEPRLFLIDECKDIHDAAAQADLDLKASERHYGNSSSKFQDTDILGRREPSLSDKSVTSQEVLLRMGLLGFDWSSMKSSKAVQLSNHK